MNKETVLHDHDYYISMRKDEEEKPIVYMIEIGMESDPQSNQCMLLSKDEIKEIIIILSELVQNETNLDNN